MKNKWNLQNWMKITLCGLSLILTGCSTIGLAQDAVFESAYENVPEEEPIDIYVSESTVVIEKVNERAQEITAYMTERSESRTFTYNGASAVTDSYGNSMSMAQLKQGDIADIAYNSELERIGRITLSADAFSRESVAKYAMNLKNGTVTIGEEVFSLNEQAKAFSDGRAIDMAEIIRNDVLTFRGRGNQILSITVDKGHGYLDLLNEDGFIGGWIEVGQTVISQIEEGMLITVPEGTYKVRLTAWGIEEIREVVVERNKEVTLNLGDVKFPKENKGRVKFDILPEDATVYVNEEMVDTAYIAKIPFGVHRFTAQAEGYDTLSEYFEVEGDMTTVKMKLTESGSVSGNHINKKDEGARITIDVPQEVEVYQDNLYKGIAPVTYEKTAGTHTITLRKSGYITRSYEINVPDDDMDMTYTFQALDPENGNGENTVSGNSLNGNSGSGTSGNASAGGQSVSGNSVSKNTVSGNDAGRSISDNNLQ